MATRPRIIRAVNPPTEPVDAAREAQIARPARPRTTPETPAQAVATENPTGARVEISPGEIGPEEIGPEEIGEEPVDPDYDELTYLRAFPDIAEAVRRGTLESGLAHFLRAGRSEMRLDKEEYRALLAAYGGPAPPQVAVDTLTISRSGATLMTGWSDDRLNHLTEISLETRAELRHSWTAIPRLVRTDVDRTMDATAGHRFGFLLVAAPVGGAAAPIIDPMAANAPSFRFANGIETQLRREPVVATDADLRDLALAALSTAAGGDPDPELIFSILDQHVGVQIAAINRLIIDQARSRRLVERFGPERHRFRGSIITMLRGGADQIVPRLALAADLPGAGEYEFIVAVTNADQFEPAMRAARIATATLGLSLTLALQSGGDPAGSGEEAAADIARSDRLIFMDQSVLPREPNWIERHSALLDGAPPAQTRLFGGLLYHPDGSLAQGGYYFEQETVLALPSRTNEIPRRIQSVQLKAVTHPAPAANRSPMRSRPVTGVPATFMSVDRAWFESLGGFTRHYARAAFEDIDFCLRSLKQGVPAWIHPLPMWHFERQPPVRAEPSKGGAILNDWLLHRQWNSMIVPDLLGIDPPMFNPVLTGPASSGPPVLSQSDAALVAAG